MQEIQETQVQSLDGENSLQEDPHSSTLALKIPWREREAGQMLKKPRTFFSKVGINKDGGESGGGSRGLGGCGG